MTTEPNPFAEAEENLAAAGRDIVRVREVAEIDFLRAEFRIASPVRRDEIRARLAQLGTVVYPEGSPEYVAYTKALRTALAEWTGEDRDAGVESRLAPLPGKPVLRAVVPSEVPAGMAIVEVPGEEPFRHIGIPGLSITLCGEMPEKAVPGFASGLDLIDCLGCLDTYTQSLVRS